VLCDYETNGVNSLMQNFTERASAAIRRGFSIIPVEPRGKAPLRGVKSRTNTEDGVRAFAAQVPEDANFGIVSDDTFTILETDNLDKFLAALGQELPVTFCVSASPNRAYFVFEQTARSRAVTKNYEWEGVFEWRHKNEYCVGPGSVHPSGRTYEVITDSPAAAFPDWLVSRLQELYKNAPVSTKPNATNEVDRDAYTTLRDAYLWELNPSDMLKEQVEISLGRHGTMLSVAGLLHDGERTQEEAVTIIGELWDKFCTRPPRGKKEIEDIVQHAFGKNPCNFEPQNLPIPIHSGLTIYATEGEKEAGLDEASLRLFHTYAEFQSTPPIQFAIKNFLQIQGATMLGGLPGHGKTLVALAMVRSLLEGDPLFGYFPVNEVSQRVVYLIPECGHSPFKSRLETFRLEEHIKSRRFLYRTLSKGQILKLDDKVLLHACKGADVFLDTAIRFIDGDENASTDQKVFNDNLFALLNAGARTITGLHHSPKSAETANYMSLENTLRGTGELGAALSSCWGIRQCDKLKNTLYIDSVKARDFIPDEAFLLEGRPHLDATGYFKMLKAPGAAGSLNDNKPRREGEKSGGRPLPEGTDKDVCMGRILSLKAEGKSLREIAEDLGVSKDTVSRWLKETEEKSKRLE
jgi:hypothetical protein